MRKVAEPTPCDSSSQPKTFCNFYGLVGELAHGIQSLGSTNGTAVRNMGSRQTDSYDVVVIGLGALGSAAAVYHAAKRGTKVIAFEQFELGHVKGASHDTSRIVRTSYEQPEYVALTKAAYKDWAVLEADAKQRL